MFGYRASILSLLPDDGGTVHASLEDDGLLVVGPGEHGAPGPRVVRAVGPYATLAPQFPGLPVRHWPGRILAPGFIDLHLHFPQTDVVASPADGLLPWLERHVYPHEMLFADDGHAAEVADFFLDEMLRHGVTTALVFATVHPRSVDGLMAAAAPRGLRIIGGKVLQDRNSPAPLCDRTAEQGLLETATLIGRWHGRGRAGIAITPRFAPDCSEEQLRGAGELAAAHPSVWIQSHLAENLDEIRWVRELFPESRSYLEVYERFGLLRERALYAHCLHLDDTDRALLRERGAAAAVCPTSNAFLGSGWFDFEAAARIGIRHGLGSDIGAGTSFSPFRTMLAAYEAGRASATGGGRAKVPVSLSPAELWWRHTGGAAEALGLSGVVGTLAPGAEADFIVIDPQATPLLARRTARARDLDELLFALIVLGDERAVVWTQTAGADAR